MAEYPSRPKPLRIDGGNRFDIADMGKAGINQVSPLKEIWVMMKLNPLFPATVRRSPMALSYGHSAWISSSSGLFNRFPG
jgi:hypothetical protein